MTSLRHLKDLWVRAESRIINGRRERSRERLVEANQASALPAELKARLDSHYWVHRIRLPGGYTTPGHWDTDIALSRLGLPEDLSGKSVLDVGAWDGLYSFEAEKRGAQSVLATDWYCWGGPGWGTRDGFDLAHQALGSRVRAQEIDVMDISPETVGMHDVVLFLGGLYHLQDPFGAMARVASVARELLIVETLVDLTFLSQPALTFHRGQTRPPALYKHWRRDSTTWFAPNPAAIRAMLEEVGFTRQQRLYPRGLGLLGPKAVHFLNVVCPLFNVQKNYRTVIHARRG